MVIFLVKVILKHGFWWDYGSLKGSFDLCSSWVNQPFEFGVRFHSLCMVFSCFGLISVKSIIENHGCHISTTTLAPCQVVADVPILNFMYVLVKALLGSIASLHLDFLWLLLTWFVNQIKPFISFLINQLIHDSTTPIKKLMNWLKASLKVYDDVCQI